MRRSLDEAEIRNLQARARDHARSKGYSDLADDFAQELMLLFVRRPDRHSTVDQVFVDFLRREFGRINGRTGMGYDRWLARQRVEHPELSLDEPAGDGPRARPLHEVLADDRRKPEPQDLIGQVLDRLWGRKREIFRLRYVEGLRLDEIAPLVGVTACRISQILIAVHARLRHAIQGGRMELIGVELETRSCAGRCGTTFRCLPTSSQRYHSAECELADPASGKTLSWRQPRAKEGSMGSTDLLTVPQLAKRLKKSPAAIYYHVKNKKIPIAKSDGGHMLFDIDKVREALGEDTAAEKREAKVPKKQPGSEPSKRAHLTLVPSPHPQPVLVTSSIERIRAEAHAEAERAYRACLVRHLAHAEDAGDKDLQIAILKAALRMDPPAPALGEVEVA